MDFLIQSPSLRQTYPHADCPSECRMEGGLQRGRKVKGVTNHQERGVKKGLEWHSGTALTKKSSLFLTKGFLFSWGWGVGRNDS